MGWCYATASVRGTSHIKAGTRLQDAKNCFEVKNSENESIFCAVISDGAGSAQFGGQGASLACRLLGQAIKEHFRRFQHHPAESDVWDWIDEVRDAIQISASRRGVTARDFASTLILLIADKSSVAIGHVGDGAVVGRHSSSGEWSLLSAPENGEYASTTYFITDSPAPKFRYQIVTNEFDAFAAFTDGIEGLVLDSKTGTPHPRFFTPMVEPLKRSDFNGRDASLSGHLARFLDSERVNERTDDDKTLVLALRK